METKRSIFPPSLVFDSFVRVYSQQKYLKSAITCFIRLFYYILCFTDFVFFFLCLISLVVLFLVDFDVCLSGCRLPNEPIGYPFKYFQFVK